jgi:hypothetical protein
MHDNRRAYWPEVLSYDYIAQLVPSSVCRNGAVPITAVNFKITLFVSYTTVTKQFPLSCL